MAIDCDKCGLATWSVRWRPPVKARGAGVGYGVVRGDDGQQKRICYACCGEIDRADMMATGAGVMYLTQDGKGYKVSNWPDTLAYRARNVKHGTHSVFGRNVRRTDADFTGPDGFVWHAVSRGDMDLCRVKRTRKVA